MSNHLDYEINKELGECYLFMGEMDKAEEYYLKAASSNGVHPDPYMGLATIAVQRGDLDKAYSLYQRASEIEASDKAISGMALVEMEQEKHDDAFEHFRRALDLNPENMVAAFGIIQLGYQLERLEDVVPLLDNFLSVAPHKDDIRFALAGCLISLGKEQEANEHLEDILSRDPNNTQAQELYSQLAA